MRRSAPNSSSNTLSKVEEMLKPIQEYIIDHGNDVNVLKEQIKTLNDTVKEQNIVIVSLLTEVHVLVKSNFSPAMISTKYMSMFPLKSEVDLLEMENEISNDTKDAIGATIRNIVGKDGIKKKLAHIFDENLLLQFNLEGRQGKRRLLDFKKIMNLIYNSIYKDEMLTKSNFLIEIRTAIRLIKNKHYKDKSARNVNFDEEEGEVENVSPNAAKRQRILAVTEF